MNSESKETVAHGHDDNCWTISSGKKLFRIENSFHVGRAGGDLVFPDDHMMSHKHFSLIANGKNLFLVDDGSMNGTFLNGEKIPAQIEVQITTASQIQAGNEIFSITPPETVVDDPPEKITWTETLFPDGRRLIEFRDLLF